MLGKDRAAATRDVWLVGGLAFVVRLAVVLTLPSGQMGDMGGWVDTARRITQDGIHQAYAVLDPGSLYPPVFLYPLWATGELYVMCCSPEFAPDSRVLDVLMRLLPIVADALVASLVYLLARRWTSAVRASWAGVLYALSPAVLVSVAWQGMIGDPYYVAFLLLSLLFALDRRLVPGVACLTLAVLTKPQAFALVPLVGWVLLARSTSRQVFAGIAAGAVVVLAVLAPFAVQGTLGPVGAAVQEMGELHAYTQNSADNLWLLLPVWNLVAQHGVNGEVPDSMAFAAGLSFRDVGLLLNALLVAATLWWLGRDTTSRRVAEAAAIMALGFFFLVTRMHVNYVFAAFAFLCALAPAANIRIRLVLAATTLAALINWNVPVELPWVVHRANALLYAGSLGLLCVAIFQPRLARRSISPRKAPLGKAYAVPPIAVRRFSTATEASGPAQAGGRAKGEP